MQHPPRKTDPRGFDRIAWSLATPQHGLVTRTELAVAGFSRSTIDRWIARGRLRPLGRGVLAVGHGASSPYASTLAPILGAGPTACASLWSASWLHGITESAPRIVHVTDVRQHRSGPGVRFHQTGVPPVTERIAGIPCLTLGPTLLDLAAVVEPARLANMLHELDFRQRVTREVLEVLTCPPHGHHGARTVETALRMRAAGSAGAPSRFQLDVWEWVQSWTPIPPTLDDVVQTRVGPLRPDIHWREQRVDLETDGRSVHDRERTAQRDRVRVQALGELGYVTIRVTEDDFHWRRKQVRAAIEAALVRERAAPPLQYASTGEARRMGG